MYNSLFYFEYAIFRILNELFNELVFLLDKYIVILEWSVLHKNVVNRCERQEKSDELAETLFTSAVDEHVCGDRLLDFVPVGPEADNRERRTLQEQQFFIPVHPRNQHHDTDH